MDFAIYLPEHETAVLTDLHLGHEEALRHQGVLVPRTAYKRLIDRLEQVFSATGMLKCIVINGDLTHEFGRISRQEWKDAMRLLDYLQRKAKRIILIKGNHDTVLGPLARRKGLKEQKELRLGNILIAHGDIEPALRPVPRLIIIGHEHPAITLREGAKAERFKCYLKGNYKGVPIIVQPSADLLTEGSDITKERTLSPLLENLRSFEVFIVDDKRKEVLFFGPLQPFMS